MSEINQQDRDALLSLDFDTLLDAPEFPVLPQGTYLMSFLGTNAEAVADRPAYVTEFAYQAVHEIDDPEKVANIEAGTKFKFTNFFVNKEGEPDAYGQGGFKAMVAAFVQNRGVRNTNELNEQCLNENVLVTIKNRTAKDDKTKVYMSIHAVAFPEA